MAGRAPRSGGAVRGLRPLRCLHARGNPGGRQPVVQPRRLRCLRLLPHQRLYRARVAGAQGQRAHVLGEPDLPALPPVPARYRARGGPVDGPLRRLAGRGRRPGNVGAVPDADDVERPRGDQPAQRGVVAVLRDDLLPVAHGTVHGPGPPAQQPLRAGPRRRRRRARRPAAAGLLHRQRSQPARHRTRSRPGGAHRTGSRGGIPRHAAVRGSGAGRSGRYTCCTRRSSRSTAIWPGPRITTRSGRSCSSPRRSWPSWSWCAR